MNFKVSIWTSFATNGYPNVDSIKYNEMWSPIASKKPFMCLNIGDELKFVELPESERMNIWDAIYEQ